MNLSKLNEIACLKFALTKKLEELKINQKFLIIEIKEVQTKKFGKNFVAVIHENNENEEIFDVFLPKRICALFFEDPIMLRELCEAENKLKLFGKSLGSGTIEFSVV